MLGDNGSFQDIQPRAPAAPSLPAGDRTLYLTREEAQARDANRMAILRHVCALPGVSRRDVAEVLGLPRTTAAALVTGLLDEGWLQKRPAGAPSGRRGRTAEGLHVQPQRLLLLGAEINVDRLRVVGTTLTGELLASDEAEREPGQDALATVSRLLVRMHARLYAPDRRVLGIGLGAGVGYLQTASPEGSAPLLRLLVEHLRGTPLRRVPLYLQSDAHVAALGELELVAAPSRTPLLYLNVGPSFGASVVEEDGLVNGVWRMAREVGHLRGMRCRCGSPRCADNLLNVRGLLPMETMDRLGSASSREPSTLETGSLQRAGQGVGRLLCDLSLAYRPARIVLGGPALSFGNAFLEPAVTTLQQRLAADGTDAPDVSVARFGQEAIAIGAAVLARHRLVQPVAASSWLAA